MLNIEIKCDIGGELINCFIVKITKRHIYLIETGIYNINQIPTIIDINKLKIIK
tara:strand:+ start:264 stop:425 length:162 start_codon:yes stop_codon:yes gene_type:complete